MLRDFQNQQDKNSSDTLHDDQTQITTVQSFSNTLKSFKSWPSLLKERICDIDKNSKDKNNSEQLNM